MKAFYITTVLFMAAIGGVVYMTVAYQSPNPAAPNNAPISASVTATSAALSVPSSASASLTATSTLNLNSPDAPRNLQVKVISPMQVNLSWDPPANGRGVLGYVVYRNFSQIGLTPDTVFSDVDYSSQYTYSYNVTSYNKSGLQSAYSRTFVVEGSSGITPISSSTSTPTLSLVPSPAAPAPNPTPAPAAQSGPACGSGGPCTAAQIATHNTRNNCWVYLSQIDKAYNITAYVQNPSQHPGGDVIVSHCGTNIYNYFLGTAGGHKHSSYALNTVLQAFYIGPVQ